MEFDDPARVELRYKFADDTIWIATFTQGCYTAVLFGPPRTFWGPNAPHAVFHTVWVRTLPKPFSGTIDNDWLALALEANFQGADDILAISMQYLKGAPRLFDGQMQIAGDAGYGPLTKKENKKDSREEGSDFNDYLGIPWFYSGENIDLDKPEPRQKGCLDCSGYMRMVWCFRHHLPYSAYRSGIPLSYAKVDGSSMPRRSFQIADHAPGILLARTQGHPPEKGIMKKLQVGDLVFFNVDSTDGEKIDHLGMYLGMDSDGQRRFIHSPKTANGPTMGDGPNPPSVLDGEDTYARSLRAIRRL